MANPFHHPETSTAKYRFKSFDQDKDMPDLLTLISRAANTPDICGIHQHDTRAVKEGLGLVTTYHDVIFWEALPHGTN
jgi:hypothetical protein